MTRNVGTVARGVRCPIIRQGDNLSDIVVDSVIEAAKTDGFELGDRDVIGITESIVARSQGNYASIDAIGKDVKAKFGGETIGIIFPILSRNRFAYCIYRSVVALASCNDRLCNTNYISRYTLD